LELLNNIPDLGQATGVGLGQALAGLGMCLTPCNVSTSSIDLDEAPQYTNCGLTLEESLDTDGLARLVAEIYAALGEKNRMLSNLLVGKISRGQVGRRLEDFLKIVHASELSALSNAISEELIFFVPRVLT
jgi:hypothetical protein